MDGFTASYKLEATRTVKSIRCDADIKATWVAEQRLPGQLRGRLYRKALWLPTFLFSHCLKGEIFTTFSLAV